jgi:hypothetical protein
MRTAAAALVGVLTAATAGCGPSAPPHYEGLPDHQLLVSEHFRYHARGDVLLDPTIMERLERHRTEFNEWFGVTNDVTDYYLYADLDDLIRNSPCPKRGCVDGTSIHITNPFHEHELVHALMAPTNVPHSFFTEGIAQWASCLSPQTAAEVDPSAWSTLAAVSTAGVGPEVDAVYHLGQRLVAWMLEIGNTARFVDFYRRSLPWRDPDRVGAEFEAFWGRSIADVAQQVGRDARYSRSQCACRAPSLPVDGTEHSFVASQEYRVIEAAEDVRLELHSATGVPLEPGACSGADELRLYGWPSGERPTVTVGRLAPGRHVVRAAPERSGTVRASAMLTPFGDPSCEAATAAPLALGERDATLFVSHERSAEVTWFAVMADRPYLAISNVGSVSLVCDACKRGRCFGTLPEYGLSTPVPAGLSLISVVAMKDHPQDVVVSLTAAP